MAHHEECRQHNSQAKEKQHGIYSTINSLQLIMVVLVLNLERKTNKKKVSSSNNVEAQKFHRKSMNSYLYVKEHL